MTHNAPTRYRPIADYGVIGDMRTVALVASSGTIDWCCLPRFDSSPVFHRLLDADDGGTFAVRPVGAFSCAQEYIEGTNVLETTFSTDSGQMRLTDLMPLRGELGSEEESDEDASPSKILRHIEAMSGQVDLEVVLEPTFDWGRTQPSFERRSWGVEVTGGDETLRVSSSFNFEEREAGRWVADARLEEGQSAWVCLEYGDDQRSEPEALDQSSVERQLDATVAHWQEWIGACEYDGRHAELVRRSALVLKLLTYAPSGAIIAAPTTSLPEKIGGVRNWDYRYVWLRDAGLILTALQGLGYHDEAMGFWDWMEDLCLSGGDQLQNIYRVDGNTELPERCLDHVSGYEGSQPVRVGNDAADQLQLDRYGDIIAAGYICQTEMREPHPDLKPVLAFLADQAAERWQEPDHGIWEMRSEPRQLVHSKLMCWVALDRALKLHERGWLDGEVSQWTSGRRALRETLEQRGFNDELGAFTQTLDGDALDASALLIPLVGFLPPSDTRVHSTIDCIRDELMVDGLVKRYSSSDGLPGDKGTFVLCSFWLVSALAECGREQEAADLFEEVASRANHLGLFAEEVSCGEADFLGNFPQGFSHLALIDAALRLSASSS